MHFECVACGHKTGVQPAPYTCPSCGESLDAVYDYEAINNHWDQASLAENKDRSLWRYQPLLPVDVPPAHRSIRIGATPLVSAHRLSRELGLKHVWVKDDTRLPSGSLKDRATELGLVHAAEQGASVVVAASTGNAGSSLACLAAWHGQKAVILAPASAPRAKLTQILQYGACLIPVDGSYDDAFDLSLQVIANKHWYSRSTGMNPVLSEGKKTVALEIAEQLVWHVPDFVFVPVGDGCILGAVYKGFYDLLNLGWIQRLPRLVAVQAEGSAAVVKAWEKGKLEPVVAETIADSIAVNRPRDGEKALRAIKRSDGFGITVTDQEILEAQHRLSRTTGIFPEPAAAAPLAGLIRALEGNRVTGDRRIVLLITGTGLKDIPAAQRLRLVPPPIPPEVDAFNKRWSQR